MRQLLRHAKRPPRPRGVLAPLGVARAQARRDELLDERGLPPAPVRNVRRWRPSIPKRASRARCGDVRIALAVDALSAFGARDEQPELVELAHEVGETDARSQSSASSISSS